MNKITLVLFFLGSFIALSRTTSYASSPIIGSDCEITGGNFSITIGNIFKAPDMPVPLKFSCDGFKKIKSGNKPVYCWHIHGGLKESSGYPLREASKGLNDLYFTLKANTGLWGYQAIGSVGRTPYTVAGEVPWNGSSDTVSWNNNVRMHFEGNNPNQSLPNGNYRYSASKLHMVVGQIGKNQTVTKYNACGNATDHDWGVSGGLSDYGDMNFNIKIETYCSVKTTQNMKFDKVTNLDQVKPASAIVNVNCSAGTDYKMEINDGLHYDNSNQMRRMKGESGEYISYNIDQDSFEGLGTGTLYGIDHQITGNVPKQATPKLGTYKDTLVVTLTQTNLP